MEIFGAIVMGILISLVELFFVHADESGMGWMKHGIHAIPTTMIFTFVAMHVPWLLSLGFLPAVFNHPVAIYGIPVLVGLIAAIKVKAAAAITQGHGSVGEKMGHALIVGALIAVSPWVWPFVAPLLPGFLRF